MPFNVWIEIEEVDEEGEEVNGDTDYSFALPFSSSGVSDTLQGALNLGVEMHNAVNPSRQVEYVADTTMKRR